MPSPAERRRDNLLSEYVASFEKLDEMREFPDIYPIARTLAISEPDEYGAVAWRPRKTNPEPELLDAIYARLPAKFPPMFESLLLAYRWAEVDLQQYRLLANPPGADLQGFFQEMSRDKGLWEALMPAGFLPFGKGPDIDYDPVCFDVSSRKKGREMRIVKIDHEEILCNHKVKVGAELASSFEALVQGTIDLANRA